MGKLYHFLSISVFLSTGHHWGRWVSWQINKCGQAWPGSLKQLAHMGPTIQWLLVFVELPISNHPPGPPSQLTHQLAIICHTVAAFTRYLWDTRAFSFGVTHFNVFWHLNHTWQQTVMTRSPPFVTHCGRDVGGRQQNCPGLTTSHQSFLLSHSNPKVPNVLCASEKHRTELEWDLCWSTSCWMSALFLQTHVSSPADLNHHNEILVKSAWPFSGTRASGQPAYLGQDLEGGHSSRTMVSVLNPVIK